MIVRKILKTGCELTFILMGLTVMSACATAPGLLHIPVAQVVPTLTPFQPQGSNGGSLGSSDTAPLVIPTFTPFPMPQIRVESPSSQVLILPTPSIDSGSLNTYDPLTGLPVNDPSLLNRRPLAIKVGNSPDYVRPQSGLTLADVVFEYYIEWGDTRFIAVMYGNDSPLVGPVRSGRYFDEHVARMYNAFLVFKFADPREFDYLKSSTLKDFLVVPGYGSCPPFGSGPYRRESYNNYFFDTTKWAACARKKGLDNTRPILRGGFFSSEMPNSTLVATRVKTFYTGYSYNYWDYEPVTHKFFRYQEANDMVNRKPEAYSPLTDAQTGQPVSADNVVVLFVPYIFKNPNEAHDEVYHIDLVDSGNAYVFRDGLAIPARWNRVQENQPLLLTNLDGSPIYQHPGRTFFEVIGTSSTYTQEGTEWKFNFATP